MRAAQTVVKAKLGEILQQCVETRRHVVLTHHNPGGWRTYKSKFVACDATARTLKVEVIMPSDEPNDLAPKPGDTLGVTFRAGHKKCMFATSVLSREYHEGDALFSMEWPDHLQQLQRRAYERAEPPMNVVVAVRFWREQGAQEMSLEARNVRHGQLEDMSAGGMRVKVVDAGDIELGATYRCAFTPRPGKPGIVIDAVVRHREALNHGRSSIGFQFVGAETTPEGRRVLDRLARAVGQFQRARSRERSKVH